MKGMKTMSMLERVKELAKKQDMTVLDLAEKLGLSRNTFYSWDKSSPKASTVGKVADYFNVSVDYIMCRTDNPNEIMENVDLEKSLDNAMSFNGKPLSEHDRKVVRDLVEAYLNNQK